MYLALWLRPLPLKVVGVPNPAQSLNGPFLAGADGFVGCCGPIAPPTAPAG